MSAKCDEAKMKLAEEIKEHPEFIPFEEHLTEKCTSDIVADRILDESKKLSGAYSAVKKVAEKNKTGNMGYVSDAEAYKIIDKYYGIDTAATSEQHDTSNVVDITKLL